MTRFPRKGHWRTSKHGSEHWVSEATVDREFWGQSRNRGSGAYAHARLEKLLAGRGITSAFVNPNARCPVCHAPVFYYQNEHGSRVFFDELGPPWPKHPCTENNSSRGSAHSPRPLARQAGERAEILSNRNSSFESEFRIRYGKPPPRLFKIVKRIDMKTGALLVLETLGGRDGQLRYCAVQERLRHLTEGTVVARRGSELSFFDMGRMISRNIKVERIRSAKAFMQEWLSRAR